MPKFYFSLGISLFNNQSRDSQYPSGASVDDRQGDIQQNHAAVSGGFLTVKAGEVKLVSVTFEFKENIDLDRALEAKGKAEEKIAAAKDERTLALAKAKLQRALSRIGVAKM